MSSESAKPSKCKKRWRVFIGVASIVSAVVIACFLTAAFVVMVVINRGLPSIDSLKNYNPRQVTQIFSAHGEVIGEFYNERRYVVDEVPELIKHAFIAAEDAHFYTHKGIDFLGMLRAAYVNVSRGGMKQGASTITQQVVRGLLLSPEKTISRKLREIILSWQIEKSLTKDEILKLYANHIYLGHGSYGVKAAARVYFGKDLSEINLAEAAILGGLPQAPARYSPARNPDRVKRRQLYVLKQMLKQGFITEAQYDEASQQTVYVEPSIDLNKTEAPYFTEYIRQYVMNKYGAATILDGGYKIYTTLNAEMNRYAQNALRKGLSDLEKRQGYRGPKKRLSKEDAANYFKGRDFEERDEEGVRPISDLEVSASEAQGKGQILMKRPRGLEVGDWLEGIVQTVNDSKAEAAVEYAPGLFARLSFEDMKWAHKRVQEDDEEDTYRAVSKVSDVLQVGDVIYMSVKKIGKKDELIEAQLEQGTEVEGAILSVDPHSGFVLAMVGGNDFEKSQFNRAIQARRQPGSSFKPIIYAAALDYGFTPASVLQDSPITFENASDQEKWRPHNYDEKFVGDITLRNSLIQSRNITTIRLLNEVGLDTVMGYAKRMGIESPLQRDFTLALGSSAVTLPEMVQPYVIFANGGYPKRLISIKRIVDNKNQVIEENVSEDISVSTPELIRTQALALKKELGATVLSKDGDTEVKDSSASFLQDVDKPQEKRKVVTSPLKPGQVLSSETSFLMTHLLKENVLYGTGQKAKALERPASGKTGTTDENRDAWFIGFTPELVSAVWVGYDDQRVLGRGETGSKAAVPIWLDYMVKALAPLPKTDFEVPENIEFVRIDPKSGGLAPAKSKEGVFEAFVKGTAPTAEVQKRAKEIDLYQDDR